MTMQEAGRANVQAGEHLEAALHNRLGGRVSNLQVILHDSGVVLRGRASTYYAKQLAQHAAMELAGLHVLANDIEVY
jgi:osmotically-inducible protein OsmY